jgi:protein-S-isoprenylcysteine O-methyltransferase Ste14
MWQWIFAAPWLVFAGWWLVRAFATARTAQSEDKRRRATFLVLVGAGVVFFAWPPEGMRAPLWPTSLPLVIAGLVLEVAGVAFAIVAREYLGAMWSGLVTIKEDHRIIQTGPYRIVRHPIYTGVLTGLFGVVLARANLGSVIGYALIAGGIARKIMVEEQMLRAHFGAAYDDYRKRVAAIIPFIL